MVFYFYTFFVVYISLLLPLFMKSTLGNETIYLSDARFIGHFLPSTEIGKDIVQLTFVAVAFFIYVPLLFIVSQIAKPIAHVVDKFKPVNMYVWRAIQGSLFLLASALIAICNIYIFNETSFKDASIIFLVFVFFIIAIASSKK